MKNLLPFSPIERHRFLNDNVAIGMNRIERLRRMKAVGRANADNVHFWMGRQHFLVVMKKTKSIHLHPAVRRLTPIAHRHEFTSWLPPNHLHVSLADVSRTDDPKPNRFHGRKCNAHHQRTVG